MLPPNDKKGSGFTNINRVITANQGNKLGQTVSSGVQNQANQIKQQTQQASTNFNQEAQKNRIDTEENANKRNDVIGRFNEQNYTPDMSKFQVSSGVQNQYDQNKQQYQNQRTAQQQNSANQMATIQGRYDADNAKLQALKTTQLDPNDMAAGVHNRLNTKQYQESVKNLEQIKNIYGQSSAADLKAIDDNIANLEAQYGQMSDAEKESFRQSEVERLISENMPTEDEISQFGKLQAGVYSGPNQLQDYQTLAGKASQAEMTGDLSRTGGGRQELLKRFVGGSGYTQGQQGLDNLLLGQSGNALNQVRKSTQGLSKDVTGANTQASNLAQEYANRAKIFGEETTNKLNEVRNPLSAKVDTQLQGLKTQDTQRQGLLKNIQDTLSGSNSNTAGLNKMAQLGLALQSAQDSGFLTGDQAAKLLGDNGLVARAEKLGLNTNQLIGERLSDVGSQNLNRGGAANAAQEAQLSAIDKLLGKKGTDVEFNQAGADYQKGGIGFNMDSLADYISKQEAAQGIQAPAQVPLETGNPSQLAQAMGGLQQQAAGGMQMVGAGLNQQLNPQSYYNPETMASNAQQAGSGAVDAAIGTQQVTNKGTNSILEGLSKLNIGGNSIANTEGGKQLLKALELKSKLENEASGRISSAANDTIKDYTTGLVGDVKNGNVGSLAGTLSGQNISQNILNALGAKDAGKAIGNAAGSASKAVSTALGGGSTGNWSGADYNTVDAGTGKKVKIGSFANKSSADILKQLVSNQILNITGSKGGSGEMHGDKVTDALLKYYNQAKAREAKS